ncbi:MULTISPECIES: hypothetical protein [Aphanothece]
MPRFLPSRLASRLACSRRPFAAGLILASTLLIGLGTWPVQAEPGKSSGRSVAPVGLASNPQAMSTAPSRIRSSAPVVQPASENSEDGFNSSSRKSRGAGNTN